MDNVVLALVCLVSVVINLLVAVSTRRITFFGSNTDNMKQVYTAASFGQWRWPSHMHRIVEGGARTRMKDGHILGLVVIQRILRDRTSDYSTVVLCLTVNTAASVLVFLIASAYWNTNAGLLAWGLFVTSLAVYQLALFGAHICMAQMMFLASVYLMQLAGHGIAWYAASGAAAALMLFSSASSRKYLPLLLGAFLYTQRGALWEPAITVNLNGFLTSGVDITVAVIAGVLILGAVISQLSYRPVIMAIYSGRAGRRLNRLMSARREFGLDHNIESAANVSHGISTICLIVALYLVVSLPLVHSNSFYWSHLAFILGGSVIVLLLTYPDVLSNIWSYYRHSQTYGKYDRFGLYRDYFASIGKPIKENMRGGGIRWIVRFFSRMSPFHFALYLASVASLAVLLIVNGGRLDETWQAGAILLLSLSPILVGEITHNSPTGRSYYPVHIGLVLLIAYGVFQLDSALASQWRPALWLAVGTAVMAGGVRTLWMYLDDVLPARMAVARLGQTLQSLAVNEFYTYDTPYNDAFVEALPAKDSKHYQIHHIDSIRDVKEGYIVVPGTSSKAFNMESSSWAIDHGDFDLDQDLNRLIKSKEIEKFAVASFKTFGTSRIWVQLSEATSYRDLILKEIDDEDRWRGRAWILDAAKLHAARG